jgi:hypothetical protein
MISAFEGHGNWEYLRTVTRIVACRTYCSKQTVTYRMYICTTYLTFLALMFTTVLSFLSSISSAAFHPKFQPAMEYLGTVYLVIRDVMSTSGLFEFPLTDQLLQRLPSLSLHLHLHRSDSALRDEMKDCLKASEEMHRSVAYRAIKSEHQYSTFMHICSTCLREGDAPR